MVCHRAWNPHLSFGAVASIFPLLSRASLPYLGSLCSCDVGCLFIPWKHKTLSSSSLRILTLDACFAGATLSVVCFRCQAAPPPTLSVLSLCVLPYSTDSMTCVVTCVICIHLFSQHFLQENATPDMSFSSSLLPALIQWGGRTSRCSLSEQNATPTKQFHFLLEILRSLEAITYV